MTFSFSQENQDKIECGQFCSILENTILRPTRLLNNVDEWTFEEGQINLGWTERGCEGTMCILERDGGTLRPTVFLYFNILTTLSFAS